jgi:hypothetical protein
MALRRKNASFSAHKEPFRHTDHTQQQASRKEAEVFAEVFVTVVERWWDGSNRGWWGM